MAAKKKCSLVERGLGYVKKFLGFSSDSKTEYLSDRRAGAAVRQNILLKKTCAQDVAESLLWRTDLYMNSL